MRNVLIIGATSTLGRAAMKTLLAETDDNLTLFSRSADRLPVTDHERADRCQQAASLLIIAGLLQPAFLTA